MLRLRFFNVGDGDCILIEEQDGSRVYRLLVDTGKAIMTESAPCATCADHMHDSRITNIDQVLITHLHADHVGGLDALSSHVSIGELICGYIPAHPGQLIPDQPNAQKTVRGMIECVNQWTKDVSALRSYGCKVTALEETLLNVPLTQNLTADLIVPNTQSSALQKLVWDGMANGARFSEETMVRASKLRNPNSLRVRLHYAGRTIELGADCYGTEWENEPLEPCDLFKVPHHGDFKSVTDTLVDKLRPRHAIISCGRDYIVRKDRPSAKVIRKLRRIGASVWFTDAFTDGYTPAIHWSSVDFSILEDGRIAAPSKT